MKSICLTLALVLVAAVSYGDIQMPKKPNFYDRAGQGLANLVLAPVEILDSMWVLTMEEGPTVGFTKGFVQGVSRMSMDVFVGAFELVTSPFPIAPIKQPQYDTGTIRLYPPADLYENFY
ncbi:MAG: exosortase system-associated protein, TIGR04073 family [Verrucomicrobiia bacterium]